jgi:mannitol-1-/sugar-/sorbitol-6-/2-deoxyglucose-6-phosphatase
VSAVLFDLDGVLVESEPYWQEGFAAVVNEFATESGWGDPGLTTKQMAEFLGGRVDDSLSTILEAIGHPEAAADGATMGTLTERVVDFASYAFEREPITIESSVEAVRELRARGVKLGVASSSAPEFIALSLQTLGLEDAFVARQSALGLERGKPDPEVYQLLLEKLGERAADCVAVEDSPRGIGSAVAAGVRCVGLWRGEGAPPAAFEECVWWTRALVAEEIDAELRGERRRFRCGR